MLNHLIESLKGKHPFSAKRSAKWPKVRREHLEKHPACAVCGGKTAVEVHHIEPFHLKPELELDPNNLITLCESKKNGVTCHLWFGHLGNYKCVNGEVGFDTRRWNEKLKKRKAVIKNPQ